MVAKSQGQAALPTGRTDVLRLRSCGASSQPSNSARTAAGPAFKPGRHWNQDALVATVNGAMSPATTHRTPLATSWHPPPSCRLRGSFVRTPLRAAGFLAVLPLLLDHWFNGVVYHLTVAVTGVGVALALGAAVWIRRKKEVTTCTVQAIVLLLHPVLLFSLTAATGVQGAAIALALAAAYEAASALPIRAARERQAGPAPTAPYRDASTDPSFTEIRCSNCAAGGLYRSDVSRDPRWDPQPTRGWRCVACGSPIDLRDLQLEPGEELATRGSVLGYVIAATVNEPSAGATPRDR